MMPPVRSLARRLRPIGSLLLIAGVWSAVAMWLRLTVVEPEGIAAACAAGQQGWRCMLRAWMVAGFVRNGFGTAALIAGVLATVGRQRWMALIAVGAGVLGAVFYTYELSGVGLVLGGLVWVHDRRSAASTHE